MLLLSDTKRLPVPSPARSVTAVSGLGMHSALQVTPLASRAQSFLPNSNQNKYNLHLKKKKKVELVYLALFFNMQLDNMKCIKVKTNHPNDVLENREWKQVCSKFPCSSLFVMRQIWTVSGIKLLIQSNLGSSCSPLNLYLSRKQDFRSFSWQGFHSDLNEEESVTQTRGRQNIHRDLTHCIYICN